MTGLTPIIKANDIVFIEQFKNSYKLAKNGGSLNGAPLVDNGIELTRTNSDYAKFLGHNIPDGAEARTLIVTARRDDTTGGALISLNTSSGQKFIFSDVRVLSNNYIFSDGVNANNNVTISDAERASSGTLHRHVFTFDGTNFSYYIDGVSKLSGVFSTTINTTAIDSITIGERLDSTILYDGNIKEAIIINRALTGDEVLDDYNNSVFKYRNDALQRYPLHDKVGISTFTTTDVSGNGNDLTLGSSTTQPTKLEKGVGYSFDGGDYMTGSMPNISGDDEFSMVVWLRPDDATTAMGCFSIGDTTVSLGACGLFLSISGGGELSAEFAGGNGYRTAAGQFTAGETFCLILTKSAGAINSTTKLYKNGVELSSSSASTNTPNIQSGSTVVGGYSVSLNRFKGNIYHCESYDFVLTPTQVKDIYNKGYNYYGGKK